jgi:hypothetical protein
MLNLKRLTVVGMAATTLLLPFATGLRGQPTPLPPRTHSGPTMMGTKARAMQKRVADEIAQKKAGGRDVTQAEHHAAEGDSALTAGHYRVAIAHYEAAEAALNKK